MTWNVGILKKFRVDLIINNILDENMKKLRQIDRKIDRCIDRLDQFI